MQSRAQYRSSQSFWQFWFSVFSTPFSRMIPSGTMALDIKKKALVTKAAGASQALACDRARAMPSTAAATAIRINGADIKLAATGVLFLDRFSLRALREGGRSGPFVSVSPATLISCLITRR